MAIINYSSIATEIGLAKLTNAALLQQPLNLTTVKFGDSNGVEYTPDGSETDLKNIVYTGIINASEGHDTAETWAELTSVIPIESGPFWVREMGVFDDDGDLIFIAAIAPRFKPPVESTTVDMSFVMVVDILNAAAVTIVIDPYTTLATRAWVDSKFEPKLVKVVDTADTKNNRLHVFTKHAQLTIPNDSGTFFRFIVDSSVDLNSGQCKLTAYADNKLNVKGKLAGICNIKQKDVIFSATKINGIWKI